MKYIRVILGARSIFAQECYQGGFIGADYGIKGDLSKDLYENYVDFNAKYRDQWLKEHPGKTKIAAGLACGMLWTVSKGIEIGDVILSPDGKGSYYVGKVTGNYYYSETGNLPHRRKVLWKEEVIRREDMSQELKNSAGSTGTTADISKYAEELKRLIKGEQGPRITSNDSTIENPTSFALEKHLEEFLVKNWKHTALGKEYDIYEEDGDLVGQQYPSDTGPIDILAISKDRMTILVVELKRGRASDVVVGQVQRYMGYAKEELAEPNQNVKGVIIALEDDKKIQRALSVTQNIEFYRYEVKFKLFKG